MTTRISCLALGIRRRLAGVGRRAGVFVAVLALAGVVVACQSADRPSAASSASTEAATPPPNGNGPSAKPGPHTTETAPGVVPADAPDGTPAFVADGLLASTLRANRLRVGPATSGPEASGGATLRVRVSWDGSWRNGANWDAAWLFVKWRADPTAPWQHGRLAPDGHRVASSDRSPAGAVTVAPDGMGAFVHRAVASASGANDWTVDLQWEAPAGARPADVRVMGVEMVYVPEGAFFAGDGVSVGSFRERDRPRPVRIGDDGRVVAAYHLDPLNLYMDGRLNTTGVYLHGREGINTRGPEPEIDNPDFPTGYRGFYVMKYEVTEGQYVDFLNTLSPAQQSARQVHEARSYATYRGTIDVVDGVFSTQRPLRACGFVAWADGAAYLDWAGLRPMTELEFEKAGRGTAEPVAGEYAWGSRTLQKARYILDASGEPAKTEDGTERVDGNAAYGVIAFIGGDGGGGPLRTGIFSERARSSREAAGASFYGVMELSGNLFDHVVAIGHPVGRAFRGTHGDGRLTASGDATTPTWPGADGVGAGERGGNSGYSNEFLRLSDRTYANYAPRTRVFSRGIRGARTAPSPSSHSPVGS